MQEIRNSKELVCIDYPGVIENVDNMMSTLGGTEIISGVICDPNRKLQLWFRPNDRLSKPLTGFRKPSSALLMKVKVKKKSQEIVSFDVVGHVIEEFCFNSLCDFQYVAMDGGVNIYDKLVPSGLNMDWLKADGPLILAPSTFSRTDTVQGYYFAKEKLTGEDQLPNIISTSRRKRYGLARFLNFEDDSVPTGPKKSPLNTAFHSKMITESTVQLLKKLFEERPIFSRNAMAGLSGISELTLKEIAPYVAYHFQNGPWRAMWVRFGYDPRKDPAARIYQTLDFRIQRSDDESLVETKRGNRRRRPVAQRSQRKSGVEEKLACSKYLLRPGDLPPSRQFFYQYCDVELPEVQALLAAVEVRPECHPTDGWMPEGTSFACRRIIKQYVLDAISKRKGDVPDLIYSASSDGEDSSDSDCGELKRLENKPSM